MSNKLLINLSFLIPQPTGISVYASNILPYLKNLNPTLLTGYHLPEYECYQIPNNMTPDQGSKGHLRRLLWTQLQLPQIYKKQKANLLFSPLPEAPLFTNCQYIVMAHDLIPLRFARKGSRLTTYFKYYVPQVFKQSKHIVCNSQATAEDLIDFYQIPAEKITPIPLAYDPNKFKFLDLPTANYFLYVGRHDPHKNIGRIIRAFANLPNYQDYQLWLAGPTDQTYTPALQNQVKELNLTNYVKFLNYVPDDQLIPMINRAIALVFPSLWEGFGFPVLEVMACGTPVITSNISSLPEVAGNATLLVDPYQVTSITEAMNSLTNTQERLRLRDLGLQQASKFTWEKTGQMTAEIIEKNL